MLVSFAVLAGIAGGLNQSIAQDWTQWRGPNRDGTVASFTPPRAWPDQLTQRWKIEIGLGYATPILVGDRLYVFARQGDNEVMMALEAATGKVLWQSTGYPAIFTMNSSAVRHGPGPKSTPVYANGKLFAIGMTGTVTAFDAATGRTLWQKPGNADLLPMWTSHSFSPLIEGGLVIFHVGGHNSGALTAYDASTGEVKWSWTGDGPGYGSPLLVNLGGVRQIVAQTQGKLVGVDVQTGALLWEHPFPSANFTNSLTPVRYGDSFIVSNNSKPATAISVTRRDGQWVSQVAWENPDTSMRFSNGLILGDTFFSLTTRNSGQYFLVDAKTGRTVWTSEPRQAINVSLLKARDLVFALEDDGELVIFRPGPTAFEPLRRYKVADTDTWTQPVIAGNRIFVKDVSTLALWTLD
jgi:outer membrane protein assembly factor BamB